MMDNMQSGCQCQSRKVLCRLSMAGIVIAALFSTSRQLATAEDTGLIGLGFARVKSEASGFCFNRGMSRRKLLGLVWSRLGLQKKDLQLWAAFAVDKRGDGMGRDEYPEMTKM
ncbi:hypothetical protein C8J55DRAFT_524973 [Lentinula edodes]|uniref:Uncharacterized protein n=1 Tax=Lentinula lateritia TaxID=40482 RepID=A0A9W8ZVY2_9AGAR|nr:hypothetical protein C8J55DRAFT_524973 [Lentinula edodes]